jgi:heptosyltransferase-2
METRSSLSILVHLPNWIGDTVMALPSLEALGRIAGWQVTLLGRTDPLSLTLGVPGIPARWSLPRRGTVLNAVPWFLRMARNLRENTFDAAVTFSPSFSSGALLAASGARHRIGWHGQGRGLLLNRLWVRRRRGKVHLTREYGELVRAVGAPAGEGPPRIHWLEGEREAGRAALEPLGSRPAVALIPGAHYGPTKRWPLDRYLDLARRLLACRYGVVWIGGPEERGVLTDKMKEPLDPVYSLDLMGSLELRSSAAVLSHCRAAVANDSGGMHVADAAGCPTLGLFGSTDPRWTGPGAASRTARHPVDCSPCFRASCPYGLECWTGLSTPAVWDALIDLLDGSGGA